MTAPMRQGHRANVTGRAAEAAIESMLTHKGYMVVRQRRIGIGIFETPLFTDFFVPRAPGFPDGLCIESKWQQVGGSVDEKYPYLVENIRTCYPCPAIIVLHGGGYRPGAARWLRQQVGGNLYGVFGLEEFLIWLNRHL